MIKNITKSCVLFTLYLCEVFLTIFSVFKRLKLSILYLSNLITEQVLSYCCYKKKQSKCINNILFKKNAFLALLQMCCSSLLAKNNKLLKPSSWLTTQYQMNDWITLNG